VSFFHKSPRVCSLLSRSTTFSLSFSQISLYTGNGGDKRYHNGLEEEGALLVSEGIVKVNVGGEGGSEREGRVVELGF